MIVDDVDHVKRGNDIPEYCKSQYTENGEYLCMISDILSLVKTQYVRTVKMTQQLQHRISVSGQDRREEKRNAPRNVTRVSASQPHLGKMIEQPSCRDGCISKYGHAPVFVSSLHHILTMRLISRLCTSRIRVDGQLRATVAISYRLRSVAHLPDLNITTPVFPDPYVTSFAHPNEHRYHRPGTTAMCVPDHRDTIPGIRQVASTPQNEMRLFRLA